MRKQSFGGIPRATVRDGKAPTPTRGGIATAARRRAFIPASYAVLAAALADIGNQAAFTTC